jgi:Cu+-exporting ATPase
LARIIKMVEEAQATKPPIQRLADRVAAIFVPLIIVLAIATFVLWFSIGPSPSINYAFITAVSVLLIACPCAMGLATPTAIMVGTGKAAEMGILIRKGSAMEALAGIDTMLLDKTGTLTKGHPEVTDIIPFDGLEENTLLGLAASAEALSEHPLARSIISEAEKRGLPLSQATAFKIKPGFGLEASIAGKHVQIGADRYMKEIGLPIEPIQDQTRTLASQGKTPLYVAIDSRLAGILAVSDPLKEGSLPFISALHALGIETTMITGDNRHTAQAQGRILGIKHILSEVLPDQKSQEVKRLQSAGRRVAFVGDGINDAPALAQADTGIAIGTGTDIAIESGDIILMTGDLRAIVRALALSKHTLRTIRLNLFWAYIYNAALIPIAAGALFPFTGQLLNPMLAAAAMSISSLFVIGNSLRLRGFKLTTV